MPGAALMVAGGPLSDPDEEALRSSLACGLDERNLIVGVDLGAEHLWRFGVTPHLVTGDFDSIGSDVLAELRRRGARVVPTPDQDYTDLDKALRLLRDEGVVRVQVHAATGGRLDHIYSALSATVKHGRAMEIRLVDAIGETWLVDRESCLCGADLDGRTLSLIALGEVRGVTTTGLYWPLSGETLAPGVRDGTLNRVVGQAVRVRVESGDLLINLHGLRPDAHCVHKFGPI